MNRVLLSIVVLLSLSFSNCNSTPTNKPTNTAVDEGPKNLTYQVVKIFPHDPDAFTQGLEIHGGKMIESTGEVGKSSIRAVDVETGDVKKKVDVPPPYFAEGLTELNGKIYQLTWQHHIGFIYDENFQKTGEFKYEGEGWGLTNDGHSLILSDGTNNIKFLDPDSFRVTKTIAVLDDKTPVNELNELEYINGQIYSNIWHDDRIVVIDPANGRVKGWLDLTGLLQPGDVSDEEAVLNGIAYDQSSNRLFVTGKLWPKMFEIRIKN